jgi:small subunit ribosomal protein S27Ae
MVIDCFKVEKYLNTGSCFMLNLSKFPQRKEVFIALSPKEYFQDIIKIQSLYDLIYTKALFLRGGGKKRKKKNYTKPKKIKHVRKKVKLRVLSYYSVSQTSILKLRKESPESPGCFLAEHEDRLTCGKTGITFIKNTS